MGVAPDWYGGRPGPVWGSPRTGMGVTPDRYGVRPAPVWGAGLGIINIGYIELGPYFCLFFAIYILPTPLWWPPVMAPRKRLWSN